jgi:DNA polymerase-4
MRKIIHVDMDAFYASVEQRDNPEYRGKPLAVGYARERGVVAAASYEARKYGVRSAMPSRMALLKCPHIIFVPARFDVYRSVSKQIMEIFLDYTDLVEPLSLDEAYLDVTTNHKNMPSATIIAKEIKRRIKEVTGLTASAGVSINKFLAKIASDYNKPDGLFVVTEKEAEAFVENLKIEQFWGVGKITAEKMHRMGVFTGADLKRLNEAALVNYFGKVGHTYYDNARAFDPREVKPDRIRKSIGAEETFLTDIDDRDELAGYLREIADEVWKRVSKREFYGRTLTLKVKYNDFEQITRSRTMSGFVKDFDIFWSTAVELLDTVDVLQKKIRLMGLTVSNIYEIEQPKTYQLKISWDE